MARSAHADRPAATPTPPPPRLPPAERIERSDARIAFTLFALLGFASPFLAELAVDEQMGFDTEGAAQELSMTSLVALLLFGIVALGLGVRAWPLLLAGVLVADVAAFVGWLVLFWFGA